MSVKSRGCIECGRVFIPEDCRTRICSDECRERRNARKQKERRVRHEMLKRCETLKQSGVISTTLNAHIREARSMGLTYAEWQMRQTLAMIPRVRI